MSTKQPLSIAANQNIIEMEYAVRGPLPKRAAELKKQGKQVILCNIGNPQALGQYPLTYYRQVLSLVEDRSKIERERRLKKIYQENKAAFKEIKSSDFISDYILDLTEKVLANTVIGMGAYSESNGYYFIREAVAKFINKRDGFDSASALSSNPDNIFISNGASENAKHIIDVLISKPTDGIMIPTPQYPLYSASIKKVGGVQINYYPDEDNGWTLNRAILDEAFNTAKKNGVTVKGIVVINPGNPTGAILDEQTINDIIEFAEENNVVIIADEVYQVNVYGAKYVSFAKVLGERKVPLFSLHSTSKGFMGECGHRGGYLEIRNAPKVLGTELSFTEVILKQASVSLCSNTVGQILIYLMVNPPEVGSEPYTQFIEEKEAVLKDLLDKATMIREAFKQMDGVECFGRTGAMYLFPRLNKLPKGTNDFEYCMNLLETTGLCTVNGSGFGQKEGTHHLRIAFLPTKKLLEKVLPEWIKFHNQYVNKKQ
jgi:aspartate/methionine/tyrosine aminotransferase